ncbi:MAG: VCBS repeat-containing protein, partial [Planctomycetota bacterium]
DLDADPMLEIVYGCLAPGLPTMVSVLDHTGATEPGWPFVSPDIPDAMPVAADLDGDGSPEIIIAGQPGGSIDSSIFAFHGDGTPANGFPVTFFSLGGNSACTVADLDGDERFEILLKTNDHIEGVRSDGNPLAGFPLSIDDELLSKPIQPSPAVGDMDGDGFLELFVVANFDNVALYELDGLDSSDLLPWPMSGRSAARDGHYAEPSLRADAHRVSAASGGTVQFALDAGTSNAGRLYLLWIGGSGSHPGTRLPGSGGPVYLPVNLDSFAQLALWSLNGPVFTGFGGTLDGQGRATASLNVPAPLPAGLIGTQFRLAYSTAAPWDFVSEAIGILVIP